MTYGDNDYGFAFQSARSVNDGNWHHVVATRATDGTGCIYIDGVMDHCESGLPRTLTSQTVFIGGDLANLAQGDTGRFFQGLMDEVVLLQGETDASKVRLLYGQGAAALCGP